MMASVENFSIKNIIIWIVVISLTNILLAFCDENDLSSEQANHHHLSPTPAIFQHPHGDDIHHHHDNDNDNDNDNDIEDDIEQDQVLDDGGQDEFKLEERGALKREASQIRKNKDYYVRPGITAAELLRARGYLAQEFYFKTKDGYILNIVRGTNPLINNGRHGDKNKYPILFVHGSISSGPIWLLNSKGARPADLRHIDVNRMSVDKLNKLIGGLDSSRSMPMLAMNFGHEVWILNRRGMLQSENRAGHLDRPWHKILAEASKTFFAGKLSKTGGLFDPKRRAKVAPEATLTRLANSTHLKERQDLVKDFWSSVLSEVNPVLDFPKALISFGEFKKRIAHSFDVDYWQFSLDEQAKYDFPQAVEFVLSKTGARKVTVFTHSAAAPITLFSLTLYPHLAHKIAKLIHWSSAINMGTTTDNFRLMSHITPLLQTYVGPIPFAFLTIPVESLLQKICAKEIMQKTACSLILEVFFGMSRGQSPTTQFILANIFQPTSWHEIQHMLQMTREQKPRRYFFPTREQNLLHYGQEDPPEYDFAKIKAKNMVFYIGQADTLSSPEMIKMTCSQLSQPYKLVIINGTDVSYNHGGAFLHVETTRLTNLPSLKDVMSVYAEEQARCSSHDSWNCEQDDEMRSLSSNEIENG